MSTPEDQYNAKYSLLSDKVIANYREKGEIVIEPFDQRNLNPNSYDVTLGKWFFREQHLDEWENKIYNMYSKTDVERVWGQPQEAKPYSFYKEKGLDLENISDTDEIIMIYPGETLLGHTNEFIGGVNTVTTKMQSRSSLGRNFIECCKCAGLGDIGYFNRWTMEITNNSKHYVIPLVVGRRVAQIVFFDTDGVSGKNYNEKGKYQTCNSLDELMAHWQPQAMLPKMYNDWDARPIL